MTKNVKEALRWFATTVEDPIADWRFQHWHDATLFDIAKYAHWLRRHHGFRREHSHTNPVGFFGKPWVPLTDCERCESIFLVEEEYKSLTAEALNELVDPYRTWRDPRRFPDMTAPEALDFVIRLATDITTPFDYHVESLLVRQGLIDESKMMHHTRTRHGFAGIEVGPDKPWTPVAGCPHCKAISITEDHFIRVLKPKLARRKVDA